MAVTITGWMANIVEQLAAQPEGESRPAEVRPAGAPTQFALTGVSRTWGTATPEVFFDKSIDNSRLVKVADPRRRREIAMFSASLAALFLLSILYVWQHFSAIEYGYKIEAQQAIRQQLLESNRSLKLEESSLRAPERIDVLARQMGLQSPQPGQVVRMDGSADAAGPVMARVSGIAVVAAQ